MEIIVEKQGKENDYRKLKDFCSKTQELADMNYEMMNHQNKMKDVDGRLKSQEIDCFTKYVGFLVLEQNQKIESLKKLMNAKKSNILELKAKIDEI